MFAATSQDFYRHGGQSNWSNRLFLESIIYVFLLTAAIIVLEVL
jgi:heme O synthase-like polyprenyltransferase